MPLRWDRITLGVLGGLIAIYVCTAEIARPPVTISVLPTVLFAGGTIRISCLVKRDPANRWLDMGVYEYRQSGTQLDGDASPSQYLFDVSHVPCGTSEAFCRLIGSEITTVEQTFAVAGCVAGSASGWHAEMRQ